MYNINDKYFTQICNHMEQENKQNYKQKFYKQNFKQLNISMLLKYYM